MEIVITKGNNKSCSFGSVGTGVYFIFDDTLYIKKDGDSAFELLNGIITQIVPGAIVLYPSKVDTTWYY